VYPAKAALQRRVEEAKEEHDLQKPLLDSLNIEHRFVQPPAQRRPDDKA
jgi:hypothetical protein